MSKLPRGTGLSGRVRALLRAESDGLTANDLADRIGVRRDACMRACTNMPDSYIDRWVYREGCRGRPEAVWCVVVPPEDCPPPTHHLTSRTRVCT